MKKDIFNNPKPVQIKVGEWWFNGNFIQEQRHPKLQPFFVFGDKEGSATCAFSSFKSATQYALDHPCKNPNHKPEDFIGGINQ